MEKLLLSFLVTWIASNLLGKGFVALHQHFDIPAIDALLHHYLHPLRDFLISVVVTGSCYLMYQNRKSNMVLLENQQLRTENIANQYETLKNQLNPHMLFNSLNTLSTLIRESSDKAQDYLRELSRVLRYTLQDNDSHSVTLAEEMDFVHAYLYLLKMRYEENLNFDIRIVHHLVDGKQSGLESSSSHSIYMKIKCISHFQFVQIFLIGSQLKHQALLSITSQIGSPTLKYLPTFTCMLVT